jgi:hypothetical protein
LVIRKSTREEGKGGTNRNGGAAMKLLWVAKEYQTQVNTSAKVQLHREAHKARLVANSEGYNKAISSLVEAGTPDRILGKGLA